MRGLLRPLLTTGEATAADPVLHNSCGTDVTLVVDASGSDQNSRAERRVRDTARVFLAVVERARLIRS